jgi:AraC-like DNA-binding protein
MDFIAIIIAIGVIQGLVISVALFRNRFKVPYSNNLLATFCFLFSLITFEDFLLRTRLMFQVPHLFAVCYPFIFALGPLFFLYVKSLTQPWFYFKKKYWLHFIPYFLILLLLGSSVYFNDADLKRGWILDSLKDTEPDFFNYIGIVQVLIYILWSLRLLQLHKQNIRRIFSYNDQINLNWLKRLILSVMALWAIWSMSNISNHPYLQHLDAVGFPIFVYILGYWGTSQRLIYSANLATSDDETRPAQPSPEKLKYSTTALSDKESEQKLEVIKAYMLEKKPYLQGELSIQDLSGMVNIPVNTLSQIINSKLNQNFFEFVNHYRVEEFKREVLNPANQHLSMLGIALECGFNSKASFNAVFKKLTGLTPTEYKKQSEFRFQTS